jgi:hypothetical protein
MRSLGGRLLRLFLQHYYPCDGQDLAVMPKVNQILRRVGRLGAERVLQLTFDNPLWVGAQNPADVYDHYIPFCSAVGFS